MKVSISDEGMITIESENGLESFALKKWVDDLLYKNNEEIPSTLLIIHESKE